MYARLDLFFCRLCDRSIPSKTVFYLLKEIERNTGVEVLRSIPLTKSTVDRAAQHVGNTDQASGQKVRSGEFSVQRKKTSSLCFPEEGLFGEDYAVWYRCRCGCDGTSTRHRPSRCGTCQSGMGLGIVGELLSVGLVMETRRKDQLMTLYGLGGGVMLPWEEAKSEADRLVLSKAGDPKRLPGECRKKSGVAGVFSTHPANRIQLKKDARNETITERSVRFLIHRQKHVMIFMR